MRPDGQVLPLIDGEPCLIIPSPALGGTDGEMSQPVDKRVTPRWLVYSSLDRLCPLRAGGVVGFDSLSDFWRPGASWFPSVRPVRPAAFKLEVSSHFPWEVQDLF